MSELTIQDYKRNYFKLNLESARAENKKMLKLLAQEKCEDQKPGICHLFCDAKTNECRGLK